jgi:hypothetical protein
MPFIKFFHETNQFLYGVTKRNIAFRPHLRLLAFQSLIMDLVEAKKKRSRADLPASGRRPAGGLFSYRRLPPPPAGWHIMIVALLREVIDSTPTLIRRSRCLNKLLYIVVIEP